MDDLAIKKMQEVHARVTPEYSRKWMSMHEEMIKAELAKINDYQEDVDIFQYLMLRN